MNELLKSVDRDKSVDAMMLDCDDTFMPMPFIEDSPHLLISKVRKHYLEHIIKLLSVNYENNQRLMGKNIYLPSGIWRCAKYIELFAAQSCMVAELYRRNILKVIEELKSDTERGRLNKKLFECLQRPPDNEKKLQTNLEPTCECNNNGRKHKKRKFSQTGFDNECVPAKIVNVNHTVTSEQQLYQIPVVTNLQLDTNGQLNYENKLSKESLNFAPSKVPPDNCTSKVSPDNCTASKIPPDSRLSVESEDAVEDVVMMQLEHLFRADSNEPDVDLFENTLCDDFDSIFDVKTKPVHEQKNEITSTTVPKVVDEQAAIIKSLDQRLALLESSGILVNNNTTQDITTKPESPKKHKKHVTSKWLCEAYHQKLYLFEMLDELRDVNRKKYMRIKTKFLDLFGIDEEEEQILSPLEETSEFVLSCKERIAPWLIKILTPYYVKGRIRGKALFKSLAKHLIRVIYQCSKYPSEYEVQCFVSDFLQCHKLIRCEADFKSFRIENI